MKTPKRFIIVVALLLTGLQACRENALEVAPLEQLSSASFWKTEADVQSALAANYSFLKSGGAPVSLYWPTGWDALTDDAYAQYPWDAEITSISLNGPTPTTGGYVYNMYATSYRAIASINNLLANISKVSMDETNRKKYMAEASFLRAYFYFQLAQLYGNVVYITEPATDSFKQPRTSNTKDEVLTGINKDLDVAIASLPDAAYSDGHAVKGTAQAFKARVLLYQKQYAASAALSKAVVDGGKFKLSTSYSEVFYKPGQNNNPEILFSVKNLPPNSYPGIGIDLQLGSWESFQPTADLVSEYESKDGLPTASSPLYNPAAPYENRDPRLRMSIFVPGDGPSQGWNKYNGTQQTFQPFTNSNTTGFAIRKMLDPTISDPGYSTVSSQDLVLMRYAEVLLNYAEAENEASGPANAYAAVNQVRARVGMPALPTGLTQATMRDRIRHERRVELALEGFRYFDLRRWGIATQELNGFTVVPGNTTMKKKYYESRFDLWPIPQTEIDRNPGQKQNPGY
ncbi:RagB/SusD family nutrient uptake outer membrane protein [Spirosoma oryzicola]|uniref:RagB/SusD family nutrient uptake outer membrane protein n=1 Tax=Spirosoma oryzicola TaxID=2898794 RepID=UPI001E50AC66|nr:RagB/SusD family nutrient uptake outer membrane protein [Spirosoma oryzicola]UHG94347.1 RagB/SusD family nutrient uptake outer membrane protein [Spirosoma oryzicola]